MDDDDFLLDNDNRCSAYPRVKDDDDDDFNFVMDDDDERDLDFQVVTVHKTPGKEDWSPRKRTGDTSSGRKITVPLFLCFGRPFS